MVNNSKRKMSFFGRHNLMISVFFNVIFAAFLLMGITASTADGSELYESYSRDEMARIAGYGEEKLSTVLVTGSVHCEACLHGSQLHAWPISGASVAVHCRLNGKTNRKSSWIRGVTDESGDFSVDLPSHLHAIHHLNRKCRVRVLRIPKNSLCKPASVTRHKELRLSSFGSGIRTYSAGRVRFQHLASTHKQGCRTRDAKIQKYV